MLFFVSDNQWDALFRNRNFMQKNDFMLNFGQ